MKRTMDLGLVPLLGRWRACRALYSTWWLALFCSGLLESVFATATCAETTPTILGHFDTGLMQIGQVVRHELVLTNADSLPLRISAVKSLCDCTEVVSWSTNVPPGVSGSVVVLCRPRNPGPFNPNVQVEVTGDKTLRLLEFSGWVDDGATDQWTNLLVQINDLHVAKNPVGSPVLVDVRSPDQFRLGRLSGSLNLPLYTIKGRSFLRSKPIILVGQGHDDRTLLAEAHRLESLGFTEVRVLEGGLALSLRKGGPLEGEKVTSAALVTITPDEFQRVRFDPGWLVVNLGAPEDVADWPSGWPIRTISAASPDFERALRAAVTEVPLAQRVLFVNARGETYDSVAPLVCAVGRPSFFLEGGLKAYRQCLARQTAQLNRRSVTLTSQSPNHSRARGKPHGAGSCCGGK